MMVPSAVCVATPFDIDQALALIAANNHDSIQLTSTPYAIIRAFEDFGTMMMFHVLRNVCWPGRSNAVCIEHGQYSEYDH